MSGRAKTTSRRCDPAGGEGFPVEPDLGLHGYVCCRLNGRMGLDGLAVRRTREGRRVLSFPRRRPGRFLYWPLDDRTRRDLEDQILGALTWSRMTP